MTWLITGGTGQLGTALFRELKKREFEVISLSSKEIDIANRIQVHELIFGLKPKVVVNCAAWTNVEGAELYEKLAFKINANGAENVALAARECNAKFVQISTDYVFSGNKVTPWKISDLPSPKSAYGRTKAEGERKVLSSFANNSFIVRTGWLYSPWGNNFVKNIIRQAKLDLELKVVDDQVGQPTSAVDLANQIINLVLSNSPAGIYHATNSGEASWYEFAKLILISLGKDLSSLTPIKTFEYASNTARPSYSVLDGSCWSMTKISPMRHWKYAFEDILPQIITELKFPSVQ